MHKVLLFTVCIVVLQYTFVLARMGEKHVTGVKKMAYHIMHSEQNMRLVPQIIDEIQLYPVETRLFIHTQLDPKTIDIPSPSESLVTLVHHELDPSANLAIAGQDDVDTRTDQLAASASVRDMIVKTSRRFDYTMYSEADILVRRESIATWMRVSPSAFAKNLTVEFVRLECTLALCRAVDYQAQFKNVSVRARYVMLKRDRFYMHNAEELRSSGVWILPHRRLQLLAQHSPEFLRHQPSSGLTPRASIGMAGTMGTNAGIVLVERSLKSFTVSPAVAVLGSGARRWFSGAWWCHLIRSHSKCLPLPFFFHTAVPPLLPSTVAADTMSAEEKASIDLLTAKLAPLATKTCNTRQLSFNVTQMLHVGEPAASLQKYKHVKLGYGPFLTKVGSSSAVNMLKELTIPSFDSKENRNGSTAFLSAATLRDYTFVSFIRNPVDRALAGYHQIETFYHMNWMNKFIDKFGLQWWNLHCLNATFGVAEIDRPCTGAPRSNNIDNLLLRLIGYLEEIERIGFYDQHQTPMTFLMASSAVSVAPRAYIFDMKSMFDIGNVISSVTGLSHSGTVRKTRSKVDSNVMPWSLSWTKLSLISNNAHNPELAVLANRAIGLVCKLYRADIECLPYDVPECVYPKN